MSASWGPGTVILGRYRLESLLGRGGMGSVWRAEHLQLRSPVAIKLLDGAISNSEQMLARFMREAQSAALLRSLHVVQVLDFGVERGTPFIAMELLQGESLAARIKRLGQLPVEDVILFLSQVLRAMVKAHEAGIIHRDLKPDNIFICAEEPEFVKVLDFGVAKITSGELMGAAGTQPGMMIGTPYYMSPEQIKATSIDARSDLWGIAVIAYECLVGARPFTGDELGELVLAICTGSVPVPSRHANVPAGFDEWFAKGTERDRERRFATAREMADELIKLSGLVGAARAQFSTLRNVASLSIPVPRATASPVASAPETKNLDLTTGQRAVTSKSLPHSRAPLNAMLSALIGATGVIVVGVGAFLAFGGAAALKRAAGTETAAASLTTAAPAVASEAALAPRRPVPMVSVSGAIVAPPAPSHALSAAADQAGKPPPQASSRAEPKAPRRVEGSRPGVENPLESQVFRR